MFTVWGAWSAYSSQEIFPLVVSIVAAYDRSGSRIVGGGLSNIWFRSVGFVGIVMVAVVTSLPELVAMVSAVRFGAYDIAVGNLFGSNVFNMFALSLADVFYTEGPFLNAIDPTFALAGLLALLLTTLGLMGNLAQVERRIGIVELDALLLILCYFAGLGLLYIRGIGV